MMDMQDLQQRKKKKEEVEVDADVPSLQPARAPRGRKANSWSKYVVDRIWPTIFLVCAALGLYEAKFWQVLLYSREANRFYINLGVFWSSLVVLCGTYIEIYCSLYLGQHVRYENAKTTTHVMLASIVLAGVW